jgi:hypothetical protein
MPSNAAQTVSNPVITIPTDANAPGLVLRRMYSPPAIA